MQSFIRQVLYEEVGNVIFYVVLVLLMSIGVMKVRDYYVEKENLKKVKDNYLYGAINKLKCEVHRQDERWDEMMEIISEVVNDDESVYSSENSSYYDDDTLSSTSSNKSVDCDEVSKNDEDTEGLIEV